VGVGAEPATHRRGPELWLNADSWRGQVRAEILDADGSSIARHGRDECVPAVIDSIDEPIRWTHNADLSSLLGHTVSIRFHILRAELYAIWFDTRS